LSDLAYKVTILIPTFNRAERLKVAISSVLGQTYQNLVLVVFDNASTDNTESVVAEFASKDKRVQYVRQEKNVGMNENFNFALKFINTPFFCFLSDDDYYLNTFLAEAIDIFKQNSNIAFTVFSGPEVNDNLSEPVRNVLEFWPREGLYEPSEAIDLVTTGYHPIISACLFHERVLPVMHFSNEVENISDLPILIALVSRYYFFVSKKVAMYFVRHGDAIGNVVDLKAWANLDSYILNNITLSKEAKNSVIKHITPKIRQILYDHYIYYLLNSNVVELRKLKKLIFLRKDRFIISFKIYLHLATIFVNRFKRFIVSILKFLLRRK
jgi:glycosyltransferase involved in cell wall biosynthesis